MSSPRVLAAALGLGVAVLARGAAADSPRNVMDRTDPSPAEAASVFIPNAGYVAEARDLFVKRRAAEGARGDTPNGAALSLSTNKNTRFLPVLLFDFQDIKEQYPPLSYQVRLFGDPADVGTERDTRRTMANFYRDMSYRGVAEGIFQIDGKVHGWYHLPDDLRHYVRDTGPDWLPKMIELVLRQADEEVDFGRFDNDGPDGKPNSGDDDGVVDTVILVHADVSWENSTTGLLQSHSANLRKKKADRKPFPTKDPRKDKRGDPIPGQVITIDDYILAPGLSKQLTPQGKNAIAEVGVFCHEFGHTLGLPDLYDRTPPAGIDSWGIGAYCAMSWGMYGANRNRMDRPVSLSAWCKYYLGWADVKYLDRDESPVRLPPVQKGNKILRVDVPGSDRQEYFLIEYRARWALKDDPTRVNWDEDLPDSGLLIWHVDERIGGGMTTAGWPFTDFGKGQNDDRSRPEGGPPAYPPKHALVALLQADRKLDLEERAADKYVDKDDFFKPGVELTDNDPELRCCLRDYAGNPTGIAIRNIKLPPGEDATFDFTLQPGSASGAGGPVTGAAEETEELGVLSQIDDLLMQKKEPTPKLLARLASVEDFRIDRGVHPQFRNDVHVYAARARKRTVAAAPPAPTAIERAVQALLAGRPGAAPLTVRFAPKLGRVEELTNLRLPIEGRTPRDDAAKRLREGLAPLLGDRVKVVPAEGESGPNDPRQRFDQRIRVGDRDYPVFGKGEGGQLDFPGVYLFYDPTLQFLVRVQNGTVAAARLTIDPEVRLDPAAARQVADRASPINANVQDAACELGVLVRRDLKSGARLVYRVTYRPEGEPSYEVMVDAADGNVVPRPPL